MEYDDQSCITVIVTILFLWMTIIIQWPSPIQESTYGLCDGHINIEYMAMYVNCQFIRKVMYCDLWRVWSANMNTSRSEASTPWFLTIPLLFPQIFPANCNQNRGSWTQILWHGECITHKAEWVKMQLGSLGIQWICTQNITPSYPYTILILTKYMQIKYFGEVLDPLINSRR